jgi:predicted amidohydrolase
VPQYQSKDLWTLLYPAAWADAEYPAEWFYHKLPAQVKQFKHHLIAANWSVDGPQGWRGYGFSVIISREGKVVAAAKSVFGSDIVYADLPIGKPAPPIH